MGAAFLTPLPPPLQARGPIPEREAAMLIYEVLRVVRCCHSANILHGDIKVMPARLTGPPLPRFFLPAP